MLSSILSFLVLSVLFNDLVRCCGYTVPCVNLTTLSVAKVIREGADKSLDRPGSKQATATKLGIYSTYSPRSSTHFLARCCNFGSHSKKFRRLSIQPGLLGSIDLHVGRKMITFQLFFQSREQAVVRRGKSSLQSFVIPTELPSSRYFCSIFVYCKIMCHSFESFRQFSVCQE